MLNKIVNYSINGFSSSKLQHFDYSSLISSNSSFNQCSKSINYLNKHPFRITFVPQYGFSHKSDKHQPSNNNNKANKGYDNPLNQNRKGKPVISHNDKLRPTDRITNEKIQSQKGQNELYKDSNKNLQSEEHLDDKIAWTTRLIKKIQEKESQQTIKYVYNNKIIYTLDSSEKDLKNTILKSFLKSYLWSAASLLTFFYIHPWVVIAPLLLLAKNLSGMLMSYKLGTTSVVSMELLDPKYIKIRFLWGHDIMVKVEDIEFDGIQDLSNKTVKPIDVYIVIINLKDTKGQTHWKTKFLIDSSQTKIENFDLFKAIIRSHADEIPKFVFKQNKEKT